MTPTHRFAINQEVFCTLVLILCCVVAVTDDSLEEGASYGNYSWNQILALW